MEKPDSDFARRLRGLRAEARMSQAELAKTLGVNPDTISNWETGENWPNLFVATKLADTLGCSLDELTGRTVSAVS